MAKVELFVGTGRHLPDDPAARAGGAPGWMGRLAGHLSGDQAHRVLCIVPTGDAARDLRDRLLTHYGVPGIFGRPLRTFYRLARDIADATRLGGHDLSDLQRSLLLQDLAAGANLPTLGAIRRFPGFAAAVGRLIGELKLAMVHPEHLEAALRSLPREEDALAAKLADLLALYQRYQEILEAHDLHDAEGLMWHAVSALERDPGLLEPAAVFFVHGFRSFNRVQLRLLGALAARAQEMYLHLHHDPTRPETFAACERSLQRLRAVLQGEVVVEPPASADSDLAHLAAHLFAPAEQAPSPVNPAPTPQAAVPQAVTIIEAGGPAQEAEEVAREIRRLAAQGAGYGDIAIVTRGEEARHRFAHLLARFEVPVRGRLEALGASAVGRMMLSCLRIVREGWPAPLVGTVLQSPCLPGDEVARARADLKSWEVGLQQGRDPWFAAWPGDDTRAVREQALAPLRDFEDALQRAPGPAEMAQAARDLLDRLRRPQGLAAQRDDAQARAQLEAVVAEVETIAGLAGDAPEWREFCRHLEGAIVQRVYRPGAAPADAVGILDADQLAGQAYCAVFAVNMLEGVFPAQVREDPLLRDRERLLLAQAAPGIELDTAADRQQEERLLFWRTVSSATERLYLSYPAADEAAKESLPSFYLEEVRRLFAAGVETRKRSFSELAPAPREAVSRRDLTACILHGMARRLEAEGEAEHAAFYNAWLAGEGADPARYLRPMEDYAQALAGADLLASLQGDDRPYHPAELEAYLACAYMYYCGHCLGLARVSREIEPADYGSLLHDVLASLYREWSAACGGPVEVTARDGQEVVARAIALLDRHLAREARFANLPAAQRAIERERLAAILGRFVRADLEQTAARDLRPAHFELSFGRDERSLPALDLGQADGWPVLISGRMDRVDLTRDGAAVVVDYKWGGLPDVREVTLGAVVQAPLYALAAREILGLPVAGAEYASLRWRRRTGMYRDPALKVNPRSRRDLVVPDLDAALEAAAQAARDCVARIRRGEMPRGPRRDCPSYCGYRGICRVDGWTLRALRARRGQAHA